jgi:hypothetical protein
MSVVAAPARARLKGFGMLALPRWGVVLTGIAGIALRVWVYRSPLGVPDSDEAVVGLMARHVLHGDVATFFWGQFYGGTQESLLAAPGFFVFGSSWIALRIVPIALSAVAALLIWRVGRRTIGEPAAAFAGALFWIWPPYNLVQLTHEHGFYGSDVAYCALLLLLALRVVERPDRVRVGLFGLVFGLAFWQTAQIVPIALPVIAWTIWKQPRCLRQLWVAAPLAAVGALPWIVWNARHDGASSNLAYSVHSSYEHRLRIFASPLLPMITGLRQPELETRTLPAVVTFLIYAILAALFVYGLVRTRRTNASLFYGVAIVFPFVYALSEWTVESGDPRYLVILTPVLALLLAQLATSYARGLALIAAVGILSIVVVHRAENAVRKPVAASPPADFRPLIATLTKLKIDRVYSSYWIAYRLAFESHERIIGVKNDFARVTWDGTQADPVPNAYIRYPPYERAVRAGRHAFVFYRDSLASIPIIPQLRHFGYRPHVVGALVVYSLPGVH